MKKVLVVMLFCLMFVTSPVFATEPLEISVEVEINDCDTISDIEDLFIDVLVEPYDVELVELEEGVNIEDLFYDIEVDGYYSYTYYDFNEGFTPSFGKYECTLSYPVSLSDDDDFYLVIYNADGTVYHHDKHDFGDISYSKGYKYYNWFLYDVEEDTLEIESERHYSIIESIVYLGLGMLLSFILAITLNIIVKKKLLRRVITEADYKGYKLPVIIFSVLYSLLIITSITRAHIGFLVFMFIFLYLVSIVVFTSISEKKQLKIRMNDLLILEISPIVLNVGLLAFYLLIFNWWVS